MAKSKFNFIGVVIAIVAAVASTFIFAILAGISLGLSDGWLNDQIEG